MRACFFVFIFCVVFSFISCTSTSVYRGGIGAYQDYDGFQDYTNGYSVTSPDSNDNNTSQVSPPPNVRLGNARDSEAVQRATMKPYQINGKWYYPQRVSVGETYDGIASWYGPDFHDKKTSNGEIYDMHLHTAAHKTLPMNTIVKVVSKDTHKSTIVRINDRGPFVDGRIIDLSAAAAKDIDMIKHGTARVSIEVIGFGGVVSSDASNNSTIIEDMVNFKDLKDEFKTGSTETVVSGGSFSVQIGAFRSISGADMYKSTHEYNGYSTVIRKSDFNGQPIHKVFIIGFKSEDEARDFIKDKNIDGFLIRD